MKTQTTGITKNNIMAIVEREMGCDLNHDTVEVYAAYNTNSYAVRVDEDCELVVMPNNSPDAQVEEVTFHEWPPTEKNYYA